MKSQRSHCIQNDVCNTKEMRQGGQMSKLIHKTS